MAASRKKTEPRKEVAFGRLLETLRTEKGIALETVSDETRIGIGMLRFIEAEAYDRLPEPVFVKGFLKAYAEVIGTPSEPIVESYLAGLRIDADRTKASRAFWPRMVFLAALLAFVVFVALSLFKFRSDNETVRKGAPSTEALPAATDTHIAASPQPPVAAESRKSYLLQITAVEKTWIKVIVDREAPKQFSLNPGDHLELKATSGFDLLIGNATGIHLQLNHRPIAVAGKHGQVVALKLPK